MIRPAVTVLAVAAVVAGGAAAAVIPEIHVRAHAAPVSRGPMPGDRPQLLPPPSGPLVGVPQIVTPSLGGGSYVFPVYGSSSYAAVYGTGEGLGFDHGDEVYGELGQPLLAVADGTVFSVGWTRTAGNRMRLRDHQGNVFTYAHLAAFSTSVRNGARVRAGEVVGFMGNTGVAAGGPARLHFEVHPVSLLYLGPAGAVDPTTYLASFRRLHNLAFPVETGWAPSPAGVARVPAPGAMLIGVTDIASGGLRAGR